MSATSSMDSSRPMSSRNGSSAPEYGDFGPTGAARLRRTLAIGEYSNGRVNPRCRPRARTRSEAAMEMHQIRYFLALCEELNFTKAAERCHVAQPSLTRAIKQLEEELGGALFRRE